MTCVTIPTMSAMIIIRVRMANNQFGALLPLILILPRLIGLFGVEICQAVCDVLAFLLAIPLTLHFFRSLNHLPKLQ